MATHPTGAPSSQGAVGGVVARSARSRGDGGFSLSEIVVAVALMGTAVVVVLAGLRTAVRATVIDRNHANAYEWLQAASDSVHLADRIPCTDDGSGRMAAVAAYDTAAQAATTPPIWDGTPAAVAVTDVEYLGRTSPDAEFEWSPSFCFEGVGFTDSPLYTQRITIEVTTPEGVIESLEMVKSER